MNRKILFLVLLITIAATSGNSQNQDRSKKVTEYLQLSEKEKQAGDYKEATRHLNEAATLVWEDKNYQDAIRYFNQSIELNKIIKNEGGISKIQSNLGLIYSDIQQYEASLDHFNKSLDYRLANGTKEEIITTRINISIVLNNLKQHEKASEQLEQALKLATEMNDAAQMKSCYGMLAETYEKAGNDERMVHYFNLYRTFHEMIQRNRVVEARKETEQVQLRALQVELENQEKEIALLKANRELIKKDEQLTEVSNEARALIENSTKQELALSLLQRKLEIDQLITQEKKASSSRKTLFVIIALIIVTCFSTTATIYYRNYGRLQKVKQALARESENVKQLEKIKAELENKLIQITRTQSTINY